MSKTSYLKQDEQDGGYIVDLTVWKERHTLNKSMSLFNLKMRRKIQATTRACNRPGGPWRVKYCLLEDLTRKQGFERKLSRKLGK